MTIGEAQTNLDSVIGITIIFYLLVRVLLIFGSSMSFLSSALYVDQESSRLKHKLVIMILLGE